MKISELIEALEKIRAEHGDSIEVRFETCEYGTVTYYDEEIDEIEVVEGRPTSYDLEDHKYVRIY